MDASHSMSSRRNLIRPRYLDLAEFDDDDPQGNLLEGFTNWPPAATVVRKQPPSINSSKAGKSALKTANSEKLFRATVEEEEATDAVKLQDEIKTVTNKDSDNLKSVRFDQAEARSQLASRQPLEYKDSAGKQSTSNAGVSRPISATGFLIGPVQERSSVKAKPITVSARKSKTPSGSRFSIARKMDEDLRIHEEERLAQQKRREVIGRQESGTGFPASMRRDFIEPLFPPSLDKVKAKALTEDESSVAAPEVDELAMLSASKTTHLAEGYANNEEWLDEDGRPMSAFRKSRLLRQGLRPPSARKTVASVDQHSYSETEGATFQPDPTRDPGGGADIDAISSVLAEVSMENEKRIRQLSSTEIKEELKSLENLFGQDVLEALRSRKGPATTFKTAEPMSSHTSHQSISPVGTHATRRSNTEDEAGLPESVKRQYFASEPEGLNPTLEWMMPAQSHASQQAELRFDFSGKLVEGMTQTDEAYLSGLHHHGDNQQAPGYTFSELLHLSRSTVAAQRQLAVNVLGRICERHPAYSTQDSNIVDKFLNENALLLRARVIMISRWLLNDRNFTVRSAALRCLTSSLRVLPAGEIPVTGATLNVDCYSLTSSEKKVVAKHNDVSEAERNIQRDWAAWMLESNILGLFLDQTDNLITSLWEAESALEILFHMASCSAKHAKQIFGSDVKRLCDFIIQLGLQVMWPPTQCDSSEAQAVCFGRSPSISALRLLHLGVLSDRDIAHAMVLNGSIDHLLRFIVHPPWKIEEQVVGSEVDQQLIISGYKVFEEILQIYISLASYGAYAAVVARTWGTWQEYGAWAVSYFSSVWMDKTNYVQAFGATSPMTSEIALLKGRTSQRIIELLAAWTRCAQDPHQLMNSHDVTWTQVRDWMYLLSDLPQTQPLEVLTLPRDSPSWRSSSLANIAGSICQYMACWLQCALQKEGKVIESKRTLSEHFLRNSIELIRLELRSALQRRSLNGKAMNLESIEAACRSAYRSHVLNGALTRSTAEGSNITAGSTFHDIREGLAKDSLLLVSSSDIWTALRLPKALATGQYIYKEVFASFIAALTIDDVKNRSQVAYNLAAVARLDSDYRANVFKLITTSTEFFAGSGVVETLRPFFLESICSKSGHHGEAASNYGSTSSLANVQSLFKPFKGNQVPILEDETRNLADGEVESGSDDEFDPITGTKVWRCPANTLPLRADWPLSAIDDLLHSGSTAVFNRPGNLDVDWQANELEIVQSSLTLAVQVFSGFLDPVLAKWSGNNAQRDQESDLCNAILSVLPSPEQILLGVMKVFMLEKDQPDTFTDTDATGQKRQKEAGVLTGRDLFRDSSISASLTSLMDIADRLVSIRLHSKDVSMSKTTLESWTSATFGHGVSFYQFFTDLVGLYDSISFGDVNFARVVMTVANAGCSGYMFGGEHGMPKDFRSLVWNDYRDSLKSMPAVQIPLWLLSWTDQDKDMLEHYARFLASVQETSIAYKSVAYWLAIHHLSPIVRHFAFNKALSISTRLESAITSLLTICSASTLRDLLSYKQPTVQFHNFNPSRHDQIFAHIEPSQQDHHDHLTIQINSINERLGTNLSINA